MCHREMHFRCPEAALQRGADCGDPVQSFFVKNLAG